MSSTKIIAPSILACDFGNLQSEIEMVNNSAAEWLHIDVMDGKFVPNISFGFPIIKPMAAHSTKKLDIHLMIENPENYIPRFAEEFKPETITFHAEASNHLHRTIYQIKELGIKAGVALNPHSSISVLENVLADLDLICLMSVNPGFGGQKFIENVYDKSALLNKIRHVKNLDFLIEVDGGVGLNNIEELSKVGVNVFVAGSSVFKAESPAETIQLLKEKASNT